MHGTTVNKTITTFLLRDIHLMNSLWTYVPPAPHRFPMPNFIDMHYTCKIKYKDVQSFSLPYRFFFFLKENRYTKLTPWSIVLLVKVKIPQIVKKFSAFSGTWRFITTYTTAHSLSLSWPINPDAASHHPIPRRSILILSFNLCLGLPSTHTYCIYWLFLNSFTHF